MSNCGYIYKTTSLLNNRIYIGKKEGNFNPDYFGSGILLKQALKKYGKQKFKLELIVYSKDKNKLNELEKKYIAEYRNIFGREKLYNIAGGGNGGITRLGYHNTDEMKQKQRDSHLSHKNSFYGRTHTKENKEKFRMLVLNTNWIYNLKLNKTKRVNKEVLKEYLNTGWVIGRG